MKNLFAVCVLYGFLLCGCQNPIPGAVRKVEYSAYEMVGIQKRDLLKTRVDDARDEQKEAGEDFQDALQKLKAVYGFKGGALEKQYDSLKSAFERSSHQADAVHKSVRKVETVAQDLFAEWSKEIDQMETESFKKTSRESLADTQHRFSVLLASLKHSESQMDPVLRKLNDHVLFLKHNLNAQAIGSLKTESNKIQGDIEKLIADMNRSIEASEKFISQMPK